MNKKSKIFIAGHNGMVGSSIVRYLKMNGYNNILTIEKKKLDLCNQSNVFNFLKKNKPDFVIICAAKVGGINVNNNEKAKFLYQNMSIQNNLIHGSYLSNIKNLIFLGSSCIYPKFSKQPILETELLNGQLESTNEAYAIAKISGLKLCQFYSQQYKLNYKCLMPCNLFGISDNYDFSSSHFFPALIRKIYYAKVQKKKIIYLWGDGTALRELMYVDDLADAILFFMHKKNEYSFINVGSGIEKTINEYAYFIMQKLNVNLNIKYNKSKPNGTPRKLLNSNLAKSLGWKPKFTLDDGFYHTYDDFLNNYS